MCSPRHKDSAFPLKHLEFKFLQHQLHFTSTIYVKEFRDEKRKKVSKTAPDSNSNIGYYQWWIYVVKFERPSLLPLGLIFFIFMQFWPNNRLTSPVGWCPSLGNPSSAADYKGDKRLHGILVSKILLVGPPCKNQ